MAQVTMSAQEYSALQHKADLFDTLFRQLVNNYTVKWDEANTWRPLSIEFEAKFDEELEQRIATVIADQIAENEDAMDYLVKEDEFVMDLSRCSIEGLKWEKRLYQGQYDMTKASKNFAVAWEEAVKRSQFDTDNEEDQKDE